MSAQDSLQAAYDNYAAILEEISATPAPSYNIDGQSFSWTEYQQFLVAQMKSIREEMAGGGDYFEEVSELY